MVEMTKCRLLPLFSSFERLDLKSTSQYSLELSHVVLLSTSVFMLYPVANITSRLMFGTWLGSVLVFVFMGIPSRVFRLTALSFLC